MEQCVIEGENFIHYERPSRAPAGQNVSVPGRPTAHGGVERLAGIGTTWSTLMYHPFGVDRMPELEITEEQAAYLDDLRDAIESEIVGPYGTVRRKDALQYLIDDFGAPDELEGGSVSAGPDGSTPTGDATDDEASEPPEDEDEPEADAEDDSKATDGEAEDSEHGDANDDDMLNEMMSLLDTHDDKWVEADTEETKYEVDLPGGDTETVQTQDDVRALLFKHYR